MAVAYEQAWALCAAYLAIGLVAELLRRGGVKLGASAQSFLDSLPVFVIHTLGLLDPYLRAVVLGDLSPFWNRVLLGSVTVALILLQATVIGLGLTAVLRLFQKGAR